MFARIAAGLALVGAVVLVGLVLFGGTAPYTVTAEMSDAGQIVRGDRVQVGAVTVGRVSKISLLPSGYAAVQMAFNDALGGKLRAGTQVVVRANSLVGSANRYVVLTPAPLSAPAIPDHGRIPPANTTAPVDFDAVLDSLDAPTREGLREFFRGAAAQYDGRAEQAKQSLGYLAPALSGTTGVLKQLAEDRNAVNRLIAQGAIAARAVQSRHGELVDLISHANTTTRALAAQSTALGRSLELLPRTLRNAQTTFAGLRGTLTDLSPLVTVARPATRDLASFLGRLRPLLRESVPVVVNLRKTITQPGSENDLTDLVGQLPGLRDTVGRAAPRSIATMNRSQRELDALLAYTPDIMSATTLLTEASSYYDTNGHYIRVQPSLGALHYDAQANQLVAQDPGRRLSGYQLGKGARCPGGAVAATADGSAPRAFAGCDPSTTPPGP